jgi:CysZ protein
MLRALSLAIQSLSDNKIALILAQSIGLTLSLFAALGALLWSMINAILLHWGIADSAAAGLGAAIILLLTGAILFRIIAVAIVWIFADQIVDRVEERYYPEHAARRASPSLTASLRMALHSAGRALGYNLLALPVYLLLLFTGLGTPLLFLGLNAHLLGRDLQEMLIARHGPEYGSVKLLPRLTVGALGSAAMLVPVVNLLIPVIATAMIVHLVHDGAAHGSEE